MRPAVVLDNVQDATIQSLSVQGNPALSRLLRFTRVKDVLLSAARVLSPAGCFLHVGG